MEKHKRQNQRAGLYQDQKKDNILSIRDSKQKNKLYARNHFIQIQLIMCLLFTKPENSHRQTDWPNELEYCNKTR